MTKKNVEVFEFITQFKDMLLENYHHEIVGIYLFGSLTYGGFDKGRSDIDVVVITKTMLEGKKLDAIKNLHERLKTINQEWSKRLEVSYTPVEMLKEETPPKKPRPYYNEIFYDEATYGNEWLINNRLLYDYGIALYGPEFKTLIGGPIDIEEIRRACINDFYKEWKPKIDDDEWLSNGHYQSYIVLNICRILYTMINMELANKQKSCEWVKRNYTEWKKLIEEAEEWDYGKVMDRQDEVKDFIKFSERIIDENRCAAKNLQ
jgi:predicted nucleotidyltransferase